MRGRACEWPPALPAGSLLTVRTSLPRGAHEGLPASTNLAVSAEMRACARERIARERAADALIARALALHPAGFAVLDPAMLAAAAPEVAMHVLSRAVSCLGGWRYPARTARLARLLAVITQEPRRAHTLGGCRFVFWRGRALVLRELVRAAAPIALEPGDDMCWDRRFAVSLASRAIAAVTIGYLGQYAAAAPKGAYVRIAESRCAGEWFTCMHPQSRLSGMALSPLRPADEADGPRHGRTLRRLHGAVCAAPLLMCPALSPA